jgi:hypothetical protein
MRNLTSRAWKTNIGFDMNANLIEILYNPVNENLVRVFHAMKCRNSFLALL